MNGYNRVFHCPLDRTDLAADIFRSDDHKHFARVACARRFDGCVQRQQVRLFCNIANQLDDFTDVLCGFRETKHLVVRSVRIMRRLFGNIGRTFDQLCNSANRRTEFFCSRCNRLDVCRRDVGGLLERFRLLLHFHRLNRHAFRGCFQFRRVGRNRPHDFTKHFFEFSAIAFISTRCFAVASASTAA